MQLNPPRPPDPRDAALVDLSRELNTERSASRAVLAALKDLDATLTAERCKLLSAQAENAELTITVERQGVELQHQRVLNFSLHSDLQDVRTALQRERMKPLWRRVLSR